MAQISVKNLTFSYEGSFDNIFENTSFSIDTNWKLGFVGRNGKGKTTFLNLLLGNEDCHGAIIANNIFDYFPYRISKENQEKPAAEFVEEIKAGCEFWHVICELDKLGVDAEVLYRPFSTLSFGERTKVMLAVLFSGENEFLLIDEPTNHLDRESREAVKKYLSAKKGFILVSHDRDLLDACVDHVLVLNRKSVEVQAGNFSSWWENRTKKEKFQLSENEKHKNEIKKLQEASKQTRQWAEKSEKTKIGFDPIKEHDRSIATRSFISAKTKKMQSRVKQMEERIGSEIQKQEGLLEDIERTVDLKLVPLQHVKKRLIYVQNLSLKYTDSEKTLFTDLNFELNQGDRIFINGANGCGKSSLLHAILQKNAASNIPEKVSKLVNSGTLELASGLVISYINQDTSFLQGGIREYCKNKDLDESLFCAILRQLDVERVQFEKNIQDYSEGQKKKILIATSLLTSAHLYIWDEPLNYIDVFSRMQIEKLIRTYQPTMLVVEHDVRFREELATGVIEL